MYEVPSPIKNKLVKRIFREPSHRVDDKYGPLIIAALNISIYIYKKSDYGKYLRVN
ncbi:MAG: hypothetical protein KatS3mg057_1021 [Herpetosiphonaceae bacterium]|nr:MAG: hypothetical protein KatS3mg057_1021 [Herpetosiphonaceae bacterium]